MLCVACCLLFVVVVVFIVALVLVLVTHVVVNDDVSVLGLSLLEAVGFKKILQYYIFSCCHYSPR